MTGHLHRVTFTSRSAACGELDPCRVNAEAFCGVGGMLAF
jgi:hypothetical protein